MMDQDYFDFLFATYCVFLGDKIVDFVSKIMVIFSWIMQDTKDVFLNSSMLGK